MRDLTRVSNSHSDSKVIDACSLFGMMDTSGGRFSGADLITAIGSMHDRGNGLGGGFAAYGIYPDFAEEYAFHIMFLSQQAKTETECFLESFFNLKYKEEVPTRDQQGITNPPIVWRYFASVSPEKCGKFIEEDYVVDRVMYINTCIDDAFVFSSGKNMGVFKGVGYPEDIGRFFRLEEYEGYLWTTHGRFPTNTKGWWGGAHPFCLLDWTVVHNGEISSYGINKRFLEQYGYKCTMETDTEVVAYAVDLLMRKHGLSIELAAKVMSAPLWNQIARLPEHERKIMTTLRQIYGGLLLNGPFTVIVAHTGEMIGMTDRIRLRPMVVGEYQSKLFISSEESAIRLVQPELDRVWLPVGGVPVVGSLKNPIKAQKEATAC
ncbi:class II glutamine amidotransferase [Dehalococcoides mccartyi]|uniref:Glutamine amidotransferase, class II n=1 Tax=Dehalococcoides mccartyi (strain VS) TaxID=311424 RepID=D2BIB7_DEHMV|nr:hypothetical protein [Dehalococcoides mccartyi]ACZ62067.1 glutamine amidotransferase, class II [Dehalococcoides mccartyi VS]